MFESIQNPVKGKGKEKDVGKRRAYVRVVTSLGGGLNLELFCEKVCGLHIHGHRVCLPNYNYILGP
jgi:peptidyl-prolyl cis-trans isomerase-like protein 2